MSRSGSLRFPYWCFAEDGSMRLAGVESKNQGGAFYTEGGQPGFWRGGWIESSTVVVVGSPIDAISREIMCVERNHYVAVRRGAEEIVARYIDDLAAHRLVDRVILATDADEGGDDYRHDIRKVLTCSRREGSHAPLVTVHPQLPPEDPMTGLPFKDWNDAVKAAVRSAEGRRFAETMTRLHFHEVAKARRGSGLF